MYDIIVVGAGPAGLTAALYALRASKSVLVIEQSTFGGQVTFSPKIENYPGMPEMSGNEFADKLLDQVLGMGAEVEMEKVTGIVDEGNRKLVFADNKMFEAQAVIIAVGVHHRQLGLPNENALVGIGVSYCAICDAFFYRDNLLKNVITSFRYWFIGLMIMAILIGYQLISKKLVAKKVQQ